MERNIRTFIGIPVKLPESYSRTIQQLKSRFPGEHLRWVPPDNLHVTLRFLGDITPEDLKQIQNSFTAQFSHYPAREAIFHGLGFFGRGRFPKVLWIGFRDHGIFRELYQKTVLLEKIIRPEIAAGSFHPHVTVARIGRKGITSEFRSQVEEMKYLKPETALIDRVIFYQSTITPKGSRYDVICDQILETSES